MRDWIDAGHHFKRLLKLGPCIFNAEPIVLLQHHFVRNC